MAEDEENQYVGAGYTPAGDIPNYEEDAPTPSPTPLTRASVAVEAPAPTPLTPPSGYGESGAPTPFVERGHEPIDDRTASDYYSELRSLSAGQDDLRAQMLLRELDTYAAHEPERQKENERQFLREVFTDDAALKNFADTPDMREREALSTMPNIERYQAANWMWLEHELGQKIGDQLTYEWWRDRVSRERDGKPETSDTDFFNSRKKEYEIEKEHDLATTELLGKGVTKAVADQLAGNPTMLAPVLDEVMAKYPDVFTGARADAAAAQLRGASAVIRDQLDAHRPELAVIFPVLQKMVAGTATEEEGMALYRTLAGMSRKDAASMIGLSELALNSQGDKLDRNELSQHLDNAKKALFQGFGFVPQGNITQQEDQLESARDAISEGRAVLGPDGKLAFSPLQRLPGSPKPQGRSLSEEEKTAHMEKLTAGLHVLETQRIVDDALTKKLDPIKFVGKEGTFWGTMERGAISAIESAPMMATSAVAGVLGGFVGGPIGAAVASDAMVTYITREQEFQDLTINNPELDRGTRKMFANFSAIAQLPFNHFELGILMKRNPIMGAMIKDLKAGAIVSAIGKFTLAEAGELTAESIQNGITDLTQEMAKQGKLALPNRALGKMWDQAVEQGPVVFFATLPYTLIGTGVASISEFGTYRKELLLRDKLESAGFTPGQIDRIMAAPTAARQDAVLREEMPLRDEAIIKAAGAQYVADLMAGQQGAERWEGDPALPGLARRKLDDGTIEYTVTSPDGKAVTTTTSLEQAKLSLEEQTEIAFKEAWVAKAREEAAVTNVQKQAAAEVVWEALKPEQKTTAQNIFEFSYAEKTPEQEAKLARLQEAVNARTKRLGIPGDEIEFVDVDQPATRAGRGAINFIRWYEGTFGKSVQFVASKTDQPLSFTGLTLPADPNTIFLDAQGDRNILSLLGHEWSHTLEHSNPVLWGSIVTQLKPLVVDWAKQLGKISPTYTADQATPEFIANVIGDAFSTPEFWETVRGRNPSLFQRMVQAVLEWFDIQIDRASEWGTDAPDVIRDLKGMREIIASAMEEAQKGPEEAATITAPMVAQLKARGFTDAMISGLTPKQAEYYLEKPEAQLSVRLHHGSGVKDIVKWVLDFLGTGEGHIAFGWGLYYAEHPDVARRYRRLLGGEEKVLTVGKEKYDTTNPLHVAAYWLATFEIQGMSRDQAAAQALVAHKGVRLSGGPSIQTPQRNAALKALDILQSATDPNADSLVKLHAIPDFRIETKTGGELYTLDADVTRAEALDLDRKMWDQSPYVIAQLQASGLDYSETMNGEQFQAMMDKRHLMQMMAEGWRADPAKDIPSHKQEEFEYKRRTSMFLKGIGIPANVFADGFSRSQWQDALRDYYEAIRGLEDDIRLYERYGTSGTQSVEQAKAEIQSLKDYMLDQKAARNITSNWVIWEPERIKNAPEGERLQAAGRRGHKFTERGEREVDEKGGYIERAEKDLITQKIHAWLDEKKVPAGAYRDKLVKDTRRQVESDIKSRRALNPDASTGAADPWSRMDVTGVEMEFVTAKEGEKPLTKGGAAWQKQSYQFEKPPEGFTPETWRTELARRVVGQFITQLQTGEKKDVALIVKELEWYRDFTDRLRADFGGAAEFMVDLMGAFSPRQNVQLNWRNAIDAIWGISTGKYDVLLQGAGRLPEG